MKKLLYIFAIVPLFAFFSCDGPKIGYLKVHDAGFSPDSLVIPAVLVASAPGDKDWVRVQNDAPWVTLSIDGVLGTQPLHYSLLDVKASEGGDAEIFKKEIVVRGAGAMQMPLRPQSPSGRYVVSLKVANEGYSADLIDVYTFIIE